MAGMYSNGSSRKMGGKKMKSMSSGSVQPEGHMNAMGMVMGADKQGPR